MDNVDPNVGSNASTSTPAHTPPSALAGGRYELCEFISKGGMGAVYRARDVKLDRWVAVKCLLDVARQGSRDLALKEARTLASLSHPNIMRVFDVLSLDDQVWIVSEWLEGQTLARLPLPLPPSCVLAIMTQVYAALAAAHSAQVFHRDVKPGNVMIGNDGRVTLIDFGVAFAPGASTGATLAGSLRYADPRILEGEPPDALSDMFSAALLQIELMTGETVMPDLAPLPLYRHMKRNLGPRLDALLDGGYPPLVALARRYSTRHMGDFELMPADAAAREAALMAQDLLRKVTARTPEEYLATGLCRGAIADPVADKIISVETDTAIASQVLSPKQKAAWIAFKDHVENGGGDAIESAPAPAAERRAKRDPRRQLLRRAAGWRRTWSTPSTIALAMAVLLVIGIWIKRDHDVLPTPGARPLAVDTAPVANPLLAEADLGPDEEKDPVPNAAPIGAAPTTAVVPEPTNLAAAQTSETSTKQQLYLVANAWARVLIDGVEVGRLPQAAPFLVTPGVHVLKLENPVVQPLTTDITVAEGQPTRLHFTLKPKMTPRRLRLARPGRLFVDGRDLGIVTTITVDLSYGTHEVWIKRGDKVTEPIQIAVAPDSPREIIVEPATSTH
jgi:serine/threonine protein kinase